MSYNALSSKKHYQKYKTKRRAYNDARRASILKWYLDFKKQCSCLKCGEDSPACLQFHHRDPQTKVTEVSVMGRLGWGLDTIKAEIMKCDVLCANCHLKLHFAN